MKARCLSFLKMEVAVLITESGDEMQELYFSRLPQHLTRRKWDTTRLVFYFLLIYLVVELYFNHNTDNIKLRSNTTLKTILTVVRFTYLQQYFTLQDASVLLVHRQSTLSLWTTLFFMFHIFYPLRFGTALFNPLTPEGD